VLSAELILTIKGFSCDIVLLFHGTAQKFLTALIFKIMINSLTRLLTC